MWRLLGLSATCVCSGILMLIGCGGSESSDGNTSGGTGGKKTDAGAGTSAGGSGGAAPGGSGGASTGGAGGTSAGGSSGGGTSGGGTGGAISGGGTGGAISGGGAGGTISGGGTGGVGTGGGGAGGSDGGLTAYCDTLCSAFVQAACSSGPTLQGCLLTCKVLTSSSSCDPTAIDYFNCAQGTTITCNSQGDPLAQGCGVKYLTAIGCAVTANPNPAIASACDTYCTKVVAASCPNNGTLEECKTNCKWAGATGTGCDDEWSTYLNCANAATFSCLFGFAVAQGCGSTFTAYTKCINQASTT